MKFLDVRLNATRIKDAAATSGVHPGRGGGRGVGGRGERIIRYSNIIRILEAEY